MTTIRRSKNAIENHSRIKRSAFTRRRSATLFAIAAALLAAPFAAMAQSTPKSVAEAAARLHKPLAVMQTLDALGMWRGVGAREKLDQIVRAEFVATGSMFTPSSSGPWVSQSVKSRTFSVNYALPASRVDTLLTTASGDKRTIAVVREKLAWNEAKPGADATPSPEPASDRLNEIRILPHAFFRAVAETAPKDLKIQKRNGQTVISISTSDGVATAFIGKGSFPERIELPVEHSVIGKATLVATYSDYKDWDGYGVFFPSHMKLTLAGKPLADFTVIKHEVGPYLVWPIPPNIAPSTKQ